MSERRAGERKVYWGRHIFGFAAIAFGVLAIVWRDFNIWQQIRPLGDVPHREILLYIAAAIEIFGGVAIQWRKTARAGAMALGALYLIFGLLWLPLYFAAPHVFDRLANFFEQFSMVGGALIVFATVGGADAERAKKIARIGYFCFAVSVISFTLDQLFYLSGTAHFVPKWIPPGQMFWAVTTTVAFALAALALLMGRKALLASRLLTVMLLGFGLLVWLPAPFQQPHDLTSWAGNAENLGIAAAAWIVADFLSQMRSAKAAGA